MSTSLAVIAVTPATLSKRHSSTSVTSEIAGHAWGARQLHYEKLDVHRQRSDLSVSWMSASTVVGPVVPGQRHRHVS
jgi:hypothetical protein